jgi:hypothetical protein
MDKYRAARNAKTAVAALMLVWVTLGLRAAESEEGSVPAGGIRRANQLVVKAVEPEENADVGVSDSSVGTARGEKEGLLSDMALLSSRTVTYSSLGLIVRNPHRKRVSVAIHDSKGRPVVIRQYGENVPFVNIGTSDLSAGVYVYTVRVGEKLFTSPFIVSR